MRMTTRLLVALVAIALFGLARADAQDVPRPVSLPVRSPQVLLSPDASLLAIGDWEGTVVLWDVAGKKEHALLEKGLKPRDALLSAQIWLPHIVFSPDGKILASVRANEGLKLWEVATGKKIASLRVGHQFDPMTFSPDGKTFVISRRNGDKEMTTFWDTATGKEKYTMEGPEQVTSLMYASSGKSLLLTFGNSKDRSRKVKLYDVENRKEVASIECTSARFAADSKVLVTTHDNYRVQMWDVATGREHAVINLARPDLGKP
jgi:WD40 repeat protein